MSRSSLDVIGDLRDMLLEAFDKLPRNERATIRTEQDYARRLLCEKLTEELERLDD